MWDGDSMDKTSPVCKCCGRELYRMTIPVKVLASLAQGQTDPLDMTDMVLSFVDIMHNPRIGKPVGKC